MYKSPIDIIYGQMETQMEGTIMRAVQKVDVNVDKDELIRALKYDRDQYNEGYDAGMADAVAELVYCKQCKHWKDIGKGCTDHVRCCEIGFYMIVENGYCYFGERKDND